MEGIEKQTVQQQLWDIIVEVSWGEISDRIKRAAYNLQ